MRRLLNICFALLFVFALLTCSSEKQQRASEKNREKTTPAKTSQTDPWGFSLISQQEIMAKIKSKEDILILDVRSPGEFQQGHVPGAVNVPINSIQSRLPELEEYKQKEIAAICYSGGRTVASLRILKKAGFTNLKHIDGDMQAWYVARLPTE